MFETLPQHAQHPQPFQLFQRQNHSRTSWMPASPSPLGSCNANIPRAAAIFSSKMGNTNTQTAASTSFTGKENSSHLDTNTQNIFAATTNTSNNTNASSPRQSTYEQRFKSASASNPFSRIFGSSSSSSPSEGSRAASARANKHRTLFLNKVKQDRDTARFNARGESVMMMEHISEQKDWRETMQRKADAIYQQYHLEEDMSDDDLPVRVVDDVAAEQYALEMQEQEMDALLENMPPANNNTSPAKSVRSFRDEDDVDDAELEGLFDQFVGDYSQDMDMS